MRRTSHLHSSPLNPGKLSFSGSSAFSFMHKTDEPVQLEKESEDEQPTIKLSQWPSNTDLPNYDGPQTSSISLSCDCISNLQG
jgi:hypothetical protein